MTNHVDLKRLERKVWTSFFEDGLWDIYLGILLMAMSGVATILNAQATKAHGVTQSIMAQHKTLSI